MVRSIRRALSGFFVSLLLISTAGLTGCRKKERPAAAERAGGHAAAPVATQEPGTATESGKGMPAVPAGSIRLSADRQQFLGVVLTPVVTRRLAREIRTVGRVEYDERKLAFVNTKFAGWIERLDVDFTGVYVRKGQTLMAIYSPELVSVNTMTWTSERSGRASSAAVAHRAQGGQHALREPRRRMMALAGDLQARELVAPEGKAKLRALNSEVDHVVEVLRLEEAAWFGQRSPGAGGSSEESLR